MRKLILIILIVAIIAVIFTACNKEVFDVKFKFTNAYVKVGEDWIDVEVKTWTDYEGEQIQLTLKDGTVLVVNSMNLILYNGTLPTGMSTFEQKVIEYACKEMDWDTQGITLTLVYSEYVPWLGCECYNYILTLADGSRWLVGAGENEDGFDCDVECEI